MSFDPELKVLLTALAEGQVKLADGQAKLSESLARTDAAVAHLATATEAALDRLAARVDDFGKRVIEGFTKGAGVDRNIEDEIHKLDVRVRDLERRTPPRAPSKKRG